MISLEKIIDGLNMVNNEIDCYYNPEKEEIFFSNIGEYKDLNEDEIDELFAKSIILPTQYEINEYQMMVNFIKTLKDQNIKDSLNRIIHEKKAFRKFKMFCKNLNIIQDWYDYRDQKYKDIAIKW